MLVWIIRTKLGYIVEYTFIACISTYAHTYQSMVGGTIQVIVHVKEKKLLKRK